MNTRVIFTLKAGIYITLCCICCTLLVSCKDVECPGFPEHLTDYFPYQIGDTLSFVNQHNDTISFQVDYMYITEKHFANCDNCCHNYINCQAYNITNNQNTIYMYCELSKKSKIGFNHRKDFGIGITPEVSVLELYEETEKYRYNIQNSGFFAETVILDILWYNEQPIKKATIVKGKGITDFYDQKHNFQWISIK